MATGSRSDDLPVDWEILSTDGPLLTNHTACIIANSFYIHGGVTKYGSTHPENKLYEFNLTSCRWSEVTVAGSPGLSHHACVVLEGRYMVLIGGWDGRRRVSLVHVFDSQEKRWIPVRDTGFPEGAGLSSHAALLLKTGEILIIGREGSLRIQRRHGNAYVLSGSVLRGEFSYRKMTNSTSSRSGHTINCIGNSVYIIGGRDDQLVEFHPGYSTSEPVNNIISKLVELPTSLKGMPKHPSGRKNHVAVVGKGCVFIHGGETFDGRSREPVGEMYLVTVKPNLQFHKIGSSSVARASHACVSTSDTVLIHGGISGKNIVHGETYKLTIGK